ncbi:MAG: hypothetical protein CL670_08005 [Balneola sp.]|jgi:hypothetical protein|nr:hypothetical protein [Balneola sp.]MBE79081.1 hypothetical protein [Balneola sp.]HBX67522.1 hypothetical protein [Balneolaceae bacterium]|tara:strand:+ start:72526 stop:73386 length:861 start_codon:yes stop_codon:yes gene_type:complete
MQKSSLQIFFFSGLLFISFFLSCDNTLKPIDTDFGIYAVYGALDLNKETNFIRVRDLNQPFTEDATREIDAEVTLENLESGFSEVFQDRREFFQGVYQHNFEVEQIIEPNTEYRLTVTRSDGASVVLNTNTPSKPEPLAEPLNQDCYTPIDITFDPVYSGSIVFFIEYVAAELPPPVRQGRYIIQNEDNPGGALVYTFTPVDIMKLTPQTGGKYRCTDLLVPEFNIVYRHFSEGFYEKFVEGRFNVLESTQRFGSFYADTLTIPIDDSRVCPPDCLTKQPKKEDNE